MADLTTEFILEEMGRVVGSRYDAADTLRSVAEAGSWGGFPQNVTCEEIGRALHRICLNAPEEDPLLSIVKGYRSVEKERQLRRDSSHLHKTEPVR